MPANAVHQLPVEYGFWEKPRGIGKALLMEAGVRFGRVVDDLFQEAELPPGWFIAPPAEGSPATLRDKAGRLRAKIEYDPIRKKAFISVEPRYNFHVAKTEAGWVATVTDGWVKLVWNSRPAKSYAEAAERARNYLTRHYPSWQHVVAYWDD